MNSDWVRSPSARRILVHWADSRPAWLWSADGATLIWRNAAAPFFGAKLKKTGLRLAPDLVPIKGQIPRLLRLGSTGRSSLSRMQFLAGGRPVSTTCAVTPLLLADAQPALLVAGADPIEAEILAHQSPGEGRPAELLPEGMDWLVADRDGLIVGGSAGALDEIAPAMTPELIAGLPAEGEAEVEVAGRWLALSRFKASPSDHVLILIRMDRAGDTAATIEAVRADEGLEILDGEQRAETLAVDNPPHEPLLPMELPAAGAAGAPEDDAPRKTPEPEGETLSSLFDRLAGNESLFAELSAEDEGVPTPPPENGEPPPAADVLGPETAAAPGEPGGPALEPSAPPEPDVIAAVIEFADDPEEELAEVPAYRIVGRGFTPLSADAPGAPQHGFATEAETGEPTPADPDIVERVSRYNFDELSRILTDRVGGGETLPPVAPQEDGTPEPMRSTAVAEGALINIAAETFILNRLPLGIMVFRDQQVLFANRALTDLVAYETIDSLRAAGIAAIFPGDGADAGPVTHLVRRDGSRFAVTARLQSITWQGRPALMLSASPTEPPMTHEVAVRSFAEALAEAREEGFILADRTGIVTELSPDAKLALKTGDQGAAGRPLAALIHGDDVMALREFLEQPARFAETSRPSISLRAAGSAADIVLFAEGQAGIVGGYFGFVLPRRAAAAEIAAATPPAAGEDSVDPTMLARISRGVRRPLNTIIGFADLIRSAAFGTIENHRYLEYARDIKTAGQEIAVLVDELDDYARLSTGHYPTRPAELDLMALLDSCVVRVRGQASEARVLVRSAISERLPHIRADRASFGQAVLNLLASAIDQTPAGGSVIVSAQPADDGGIVVNVRDGGQSPTDLGDRFVVFRDGVGKDGEALAPVRSSVGLALTRSLVAVNACSLSVDPAGATGTLFSLAIPADLVEAVRSA